MTNKLEQDKAIITGAPDGNYKSVKILGDKPAIWVPDNYRSLADIRESIADKERIAELEKAQNQLLSLIYNCAVGYVAMGYPVDIEGIASEAYEITGIDAEQVKGGDGFHFNDLDFEPSKRR